MAPAIGRHRPSGSARPSRHARTPSGSGHGRGRELGPHRGRPVHDRPVAVRHRSAPSGGTGQRGGAAHRAPPDPNPPPRREIRDRENEVAFGGMRNPRWSLRGITGALALGRACRDALRVVLSSDAPQLPPSGRSSPDGTRLPSRACPQSQRLAFRWPPEGPYARSWAHSTQRPRASGRRSWRPTQSIGGSIR